MSALMFTRDARRLPFVPITVAAMESIREHTPKGRPYAVATYVALLELANELREDRVAITYAGLIEMVGAGRTTIKQALANLAAAGVVEMHEQMHGRGQIENEYVVVEPPSKDDVVSGTPRRQATDPPSPGDQPVRARPSQPSAAQAVIQTAEKKEKKVPLSPIRYEGHVVESDVVGAAISLLGTFNEEACRCLSAKKANGKPSPHLTQIMGALLANPDATVAQWDAGLRRAIEHPPQWAEGRALQLGDIFGPNAAAHTLTPPSAQLVAAKRTGRPTSNGDLLADALARRDAGRDTIEGTAHELHR